MLAGEGPDQADRLRCFCRAVVDSMSTEQVGSSSSEGGLLLGPKGSLATAAACTASVEANMSMEETHVAML